MQPQNQQMPYGMFQEDAEKIQRRRALLAGVMAQAQPRQGQMVGGHYIRGNGLGQVAALVAGALMGKDKTPEMEETARARYQQSLREGLTGYFDQRDGRAGGVMDDQQAQNLMENDVAPQLAEPIKANPREAVIGAMSSRHPELQALGQADLGRMGPKQLDPRFIKEYEGQFFDLSSGKPVPLGGARFGETTIIDGDLYQVGPNGQLRKLDNAPKVNVNLPGAVPEPLAKAQPKNFEEIRGTAQSAIRQVQSADRLEKLAADPQIIAGALAKPELFLTSLAARLGFTGPDAASKTQAMLREMAQGTLSNVKMLPGPLSEKELPFLEAATSGQIEFTPEVLLHIARLQKIAAHNSLMDAYQLFESNSKLPGGDAYAQAYKLPRQGSYQLDPSVYSVDEGNFATLAPAAGVGAKPARPQPSAPSTPIVKNWKQ